MTILVNGEMILYGFVGDSFWGDGFTAREVIDGLAEHGRDEDLTVRINSGGGYVDEGIAIFNALSNHKGKVTVIVDSLAASSASVIAMAGEERIMRKGSSIMIHDPSTVVWGTADDMEKAVRALETQADNIAGIYADATGEDVEDLRADMKAETWLSADEAVERGFATAANDKKAKAAAAYDYSIYANAPARLVALAKQKDWSRDRPSSRATASAKPSTAQTKEIPDMSDKTQADITAAETEKAVAAAADKAKAETKDRIKAIVTHAEAKGRETLAEHFAYNTDMSVDDVAAALTAAPKAAATTTDPATGYEQQRLAAASLTQPVTGGDKTGGKSGLSAAVDRRIANMKRTA